MDIQIIGSTGSTRSRISKSTGNHTSGTRMAASCTHSRQILEAPLLGTWTTATRMAAMTGTGADGREHPMMALSPWELGGGSESES
ncbi:MAG: hypothetical protein CXT66_06800, partial [Methanobacteriota archaeon]